MKHNIIDMIIMLVVSVAIGGQLHAPLVGGCLACGFYIAWHGRRY